MEPKSYGALHSLFKQEQGEKIAPCIFKLKGTQAIKEYLDHERIIYEVYQEAKALKGPSELFPENVQPVDISLGKMRNHTKSDRHAKKC